MAEFQEVMKQAKRMCEASGDTCLKCPTDGGGTCAFIKGPWRLTKEEIAETERIVMGWAAKNPEQMYPSWNEAWKQLFPTTAERNAPCVRYFMDKERAEMCCTAECRECHKQPIPADIAEKLGIKPIGEGKR